MRRHPKTEDLMARASESVRRLNADLSRFAPVPVMTVDPSPRDKAPHGRCPHTGRAYRSKTEARWAADHPEHRYEALAIATPCGVYWPDFAAYESDILGNRERFLVEVKGGFIRDRAMHKVKAALRPAKALGFPEIWLARWDGGGWSLKQVTEGAR